MKNLPKSYDTNLAELPKEQREAIEEDKKRWLEAHRRFTRQSIKQIRYWLDHKIKPGEYQDDMRRRLNTLRRNRK